MKKAITALWRFVCGEDGPTSVEYAVMIMLVFLACLLSVQTIGASLRSNLDQSSQAIEDSLQ